MVQQMEEGEVREDTAAKWLKVASTDKLLAELALRERGRKTFALVRNKDGKFHAGHRRFTGIGKMYTPGLYHALKWFKNGSVMDYDNGTASLGNENRDMSEYTVIEYRAVEVGRIPADKWMEEHGSQAKRR